MAPSTSERRIQTKEGGQTKRAKRRRFGQTLRLGAILLTAVCWGIIAGGSLHEGVLGAGQGAEDGDPRTTPKVPSGSNQQHKRFPQGAATQNQQAPKCPPQAREQEEGHRKGQRTLEHLGQHHQPGNPTTEREPRNGAEKVAGRAQRPDRRGEEAPRTRRSRNRGGGSQKPGGRAGNPPGRSTPWTCRSWRRSRRQGRFEQTAGQCGIGTHAEEHGGALPAAARCGEGEATQRDEAPHAEDAGEPGDRGGRRQDQSRHGDEERCPGALWSSTCPKEFTGVVTRRWKL